MSAQFKIHFLLYKNSFKISRNFPGHFYGQVFLFLFLQVIFEKDVFVLVVLNDALAIVNIFCLSYLGCYSSNTV
jgi:hypothetical protein